jgi:hypothetical protein
MYPGKNYTSGGKSRHPDPLELVSNGVGGMILSFKWLKSEVFKKDKKIKQID